MNKDFEPSDRIRDLMRQSKETLREGYDGHNHRPIATPMDSLRNRVLRRKWKQIMEEWKRQRE